MRTEAYTTLSNKTTALVFAVLMLFSIGALAVDSSNSSVQDSGLTVFGGIQKGVAGIGSFFTNTITSIQELGRLQTDYEQLARRLHSLQENITDMNELRLENRRLREALHFSSAMQYDNIPAQIIARDPGNLFNTFTVNKGTRHGLENGYPVVAIQDGKQGLVGRIAAAGRTTSIVQPMFDSRSHIAARLQESRHEGLASGTGQIEAPLELQFIPQQARSDIRSGDVVITSGQSQLFPSGILIGTIDSIQAMPYETSLSVKLDPLVDFSKLELVYIVAENIANGVVQ